jgi:hypothetical protein
MRPNFQRLRGGTSAHYTTTRFGGFSRKSPSRISPITLEVKQEGKPYAAFEDLIAVGAFNERLKSNDDFDCSLTVSSDNIEHLPDFFQIWRFCAQPV